MFILQVRSAIRNPWAHCNFTEWDTLKFNLSLQTIEDLIFLLKLNGADESQIIGEINKWRTNGKYTNYLIFFKYYTFKMYFFILLYLAFNMYLSIFFEQYVPYLMQYY